MITEVMNMYHTGVGMVILGGVFGFVMGISGWDYLVLRSLSMAFGVVFVIGIVITAYYLPLANQEHENQQHIEQVKESQLKNMSCNSIQSYLLASLPADNDTTKFAHSVLDIKCKGVSTN